MLTDFPGLLLWMVPGAIVWLIGEVLILRAAASRQERSPRGPQIHLVGLSLLMLGLTVAGVVTAAVHANWLVAAVIVSAFLPIAVYFGVLATKQAPH